MRGQLAQVLDPHGRMTAANAGQRAAMAARAGHVAESKEPLDKTTHGSFICAIDRESVIDIGPSSYNHSKYGNIGISVTGPFSFTETSGNASWAFENGSWVVTLLRRLGPLPKGCVIRHTPDGTSNCIPFHGDTKDAGCHLEFQGVFKITLAGDTSRITIGPNTYHHSKFGNIPIIVTSPTTFTEKSGNASFHFQNGAWDGTMLKDVGVGPPGMVYRFQPYVPGEGGRCCTLQ